jgi:sulfoxide reductase heme-binding subunit YedZ
LAFAHYIGYLSLWLTGSLPLSTYLNTTIIVGLVALLALFIGFLTSNTYSIQLLKKNWKCVQMVAYPAFFGTIVHIYLINPFSGTVLFVVFGIYAVMKALEWRGVKL